MFTRLRNAIKAKHDLVNIPFSNIKFKMLTILHQEGFVNNVSIVENDSSFKDIQVSLKYNKDGISEISCLKRISKSGGQHFVSKSQIPKVLRGFGICILSTSKGILSGKQARINNVGGELLGIIY